MEKTTTIKDFHSTSYGGVFQIIKKRKVFKKLPFVISISLSTFLFIILMFLSPNNSFTILEVTSDKVFSLFPSLLGFSLGGFAIVVGFSNTELIEEGSKTNEYSLYQILNAIFSLCIIFQIAATFLSFFGSWLVDIDVTKIFNYYNELGAKILNGFLFYLMFFSAIYSLALTPYLVFNLFTLSQVNNLFLTIRKMKRNNSNSCNP